MSKTGSEEGVRYGLMLILFVLLVSLAFSPCALQKLALEKSSTFGQAIFKAKSLSLSDPFSWSLAGVSWEPIEWAHFIFSFLISASDLQRIAFIAFCFFIGAWGCFKLASFFQLGKVSSFLSVLIFLVLCKVHISEDSHLWGILLLPSLLLWSFRLERGDLLKILLGSLLWFQSDRSSFVFPWCLLLLALGAFSRREFRKGRKYFIIFGIVSVLSACNLQAYNMSGALVFYPLKILSSHQALFSSLSGFQSPNFHEQKLLVGFVVLLVFFLLSLKLEFPAGFSLLALSSVILALFTTKYYLVFFVVISIVVGKTGKHFLQESAQKESCFKRGVLAFCLSALLLPSIGKVFSKNDQQRMQLQEGISSLVSYYGEEEELRLFHSPEFSDLLSVNKVKIFFDDRELFFLHPLDSPKGSVGADYQELTSLGGKWQEVLKFWKFNGAMLPDTHPLSGLLIERGWRIFKRADVVQPKKLTPNQTKTVLFLVP